jgi:hypothetical protein
MLLVNQNLSGSIGRPEEHAAIRSAALAQRFALDNFEPSIRHKELSSSYYASH